MRLLTHNAELTMPKFESTTFYDFFDHADDGTWLRTERAFKMVEGPLTEAFNDLYFFTSHTPEGYEFKVIDKKGTIQKNINGQAMQDFMCWFITGYGYNGE